MKFDIIYSAIGVPFWLPFAFPFLVLDAMTGGTIARALDEQHAKAVKERFGDDDDDVSDGSKE